jgi:hypothetical protein
VEDAGKSTPAAVARTLSISRREISGGRLVRQAKIIKMPMLVVSGEEDQIVDPHSVSAWAGSVQRAEICLMDACGHLPMIERPADFAAQILAFLTGDARYLDQSAPPPAAPDDGEAFPADDQHASAFSDDGDDLGSRDPYADTSADANPNADDAADITVEYPIEDVHPEPNGPPRIHRKRGGRYPAEARDGQEPDPEPPESTFRGRERHATSADDPIPELPADLFDWPEPRRGPRRPPENPEGDDPTGTPNGPSRA